MCRSNEVRAPGLLRFGLHISKGDFIYAAYALLLASVMPWFHQDLCWGYSKCGFEHSVEHGAMLDAAPIFQYQISLTSVSDPH